MLEYACLCANEPKTIERNLNQVKLFGSTRAGSRVAKRPPKQKKPLKTLAILLAILLCLEGLYFFCIYSQNAFVAKWRTIYINTAMNTMRHQWLATYFIPPDIIQQVRHDYGLAIGSAVGKESGWSKGDSSGADSSKVMEAHVTTSSSSEQTLTPEQQEAQKRDAFYELFWELDQTTMDAYVSANPDVIASGWDHILINEAGFDDQGTSIQTTMGEQVLAIDAVNEILIVRESGSGYRGVLAIAKDPSRLSVEMASSLGSYGQLSGDIASQHNGVLAMNASGFLDPGGNGNGGLLAGYAMSNGVAYGEHFGAWAYKRIELHSDNLFYIKDANSSVSDDCTDAVEFQPAMIIDGEKVVDYAWTGTQPRACIGQSDKYEILMLAIEGRMPLDGIIGTDVNTCSDILLQHHCMQAMNLDGGASAMIWYDGEYIVQSASAPLRYSGGRPLPNAFVYKSADASTAN